MLSQVPLFMGKIIQMFDVFNIRFGATLVGPTGAGKTTCYRMLAAVMTDLRNKGSVNPEFQVINDCVGYVSDNWNNLTLCRLPCRSILTRRRTTNGGLTHHRDRCASLSLAPPTYKIRLSSMRC